MGAAGYTDTRELLQAVGILPFGNPKEINDQSIATLKVMDQNIVFLGLEEVVYKIDDKKAVEKISELTGEGYKVIPFVHWGVEYQHRPNQRQMELAHEFIDAGAVAVLGCHPHVVQSFENYKGRPIFYSLGNSIFDQDFSQDTQEGLSTAIIIANDQIEVYFLPIRIIKSQMRLMTIDERENFLQKFVTYGDYPADWQKDIENGHIILSLKNI
jgi:poly-gamma-glutamate synthesis protein (capsule biosynthesis protein)